MAKVAGPTKKATSGEARSLAARVTPRTVPVCVNGHCLRFPPCFERCEEMPE